MDYRVGGKSIMAESRALRKSLNRYCDLENICLYMQDRVRADSSGKFLQTKLDEIIAYRNQLAHGETPGQATELTLDETVEILEAILCRVG